MTYGEDGSHSERIAVLEARYKMLVDEVSKKAGKGEVDGIREAVKGKADKGAVAPLARIVWTAIGVLLVGVGGLFFSLIKAGASGP
jgi:hypothetical protein